MGKNIRRYQGNDYPFRATITFNGETSLTGKTVTMSFKIGNNAKHTLSGTITDEAKGKVMFIPTVASVEDVGVGVYDIDVNDGTYTATYLSEDIEILEGVPG